MLRSTRYVQSDCPNWFKATVLCIVLLSIASASLIVFRLLASECARTEPAPARGHGYTASDAATERPVGACPADWNRRGRRCFKSTEPIIFDDAVQRCGELDALPASVRSEAENKWILEQIGNAIGQHSTFYIGLKFSFGNGSFYWLDGTAGTCRNWKSYAPLVSYGVCTEVLRENGGRWDTAPCHREQPVLCAMPIMKP